MKQLEKHKESDFIDAVTRGIDAFEEAGRILVELIDNDPGAKARILNSGKGITEDTLDIFERIGRKQLYYRLCLNEAPGVRALRNCQFSEQIRYSDEPVEMLLYRSGKTESLKVSVWAMTPNQVKQVFGNKRIRTLGEQRAWIENERNKPQNVTIDRPYTIKRGKIIFHAPCELTVQQMGLLLAEAAA